MSLTGHEPLDMNTSGRNEKSETAAEHIPTPRFLRPGVNQEYQPNNSQRRKRVLLALLLPTTLLATAALAWTIISMRSNGYISYPAPGHTIAAISPSPPSHTSQQLDIAGKPLNACYCGRNVTEALSLGCVFDIISPSWQPPHCHDPHLEQKMLDAASVYNPDGRWHYYKDPSKTSEYTLEEFSHLANYWEHEEGPAGAYISWEWHMLHCLYLYEKLVRAREGKVVIEEKYEGLGHAEHCTGMFLRPEVTFTVVALDGEVHG